MAISKEKKRAIAAKLTDALSEATSSVFVGFNKLSVEEGSALRSDLKKAGVRYYVVKKTLLRRALTDQKVPGTMPELPGEVALAWSAEADTTIPARMVHEFGSKAKAELTILGGVFEDTFMDAAQMKAIATIPPMPVLRGMFVNVINSPIQGFVTALDKIREQKAA